MNSSPPTARASQVSIFPTYISPSPSKTSREISYGYPQAIESDERSELSAILRTPSEIWQQITNEYLNQKDAGSVRLLCHEIYNKLVSTIRHIKISKAEDFPKALSFFNRVRAHILTLEGCKVNVDALIDSLPSLQHLNLITLNLTYENLIAILRSAPNLTTLNVGIYSSLSPGIFVKVIKEMGVGALKQLKTVSLSYMQINNADLAALIKLAPNVTSLDVYRCEQLSPGIFVDMLKEMDPGALKQLKTVNLSGTKINNADLAALIKLAPHLTVLNVSECEQLFPDIFVDMLKEMGPGALKQLKTVNLFRTEVNKAGLAALIKLAPHLTVLYVSGSKQYSLDNFVDVLEEIGPGALEQLKAVDLHNTDINSAGLMRLIKLAPHLTELNVEGCQQLSPDIFVDMLKEIGPGALKQLKTVNLSYAYINNAGLMALIKLAPHLTVLNVSGCPRLSPGIFVDMLKEMGPGALKQLKTVNLSGTKINNADLAALMKLAPNIISVDVSNCENLSPGVLAIMEASALEKLEEVNLSSTKINNADLGALLQHSSNLDSLFLKDCKNLSRSVFQNMNSDTLEKLNRLSHLTLSKKDFIFDAVIKPTMVIRRKQDFLSFV